MRALLAALFLFLCIGEGSAQEPSYQPRFGNGLTGRVIAAEWRWPQEVVASRYDCRRKGQCSRSKRTASGEMFSLHALTFAHKTMKFGTRVRFTHRGRSVVCRCNDRGPFIKGRTFDLAEACALAIGIHGVHRVKAERA